MLLAAALALLAAGAAPAPTVASVGAALRGAPAWRARFEQRYVPAGFDEGTADVGAVTVSAPGQLRFDYEGDEPRAFAFDGAVARMVDVRAGTCDAVRLDERRVGGLPLALLLDPGRVLEAFAAESGAGELRLTPRVPDPDVKRIRLTVDATGLPATLEILDGAGNRNGFTFAGWARETAPDLAVFRPSLPGQPPCAPRD